MDNDIKRFVAMVRKEADKDEDFVAARVKKTPLWKLLCSRYDNMEELLETALKKSTWYERMRGMLAKQRRQDVNMYSRSEPVDEQAKNLVMKTSYGTLFSKDEHYAFEKFMWRYGSDEAIKIAKEVVIEYPADGSLYGKFRDEFDARRRR